MFRIVSLLIVFNFYFQLAHSQDLYMPKEIHEAYKKGTRSPNGPPAEIIGKIILQDNNSVTWYSLNHKLP